MTMQKTIKNHEKQVQKSSTFVLPRRLLLNYLIEFNCERERGWCLGGDQTGNSDPFSLQLKYKPKRSVFSPVFTSLRELFLVVFDLLIKCALSPFVLKKSSTNRTTRILSPEIEKAPLRGP